MAAYSTSGRERTSTGPWAANRSMSQSLAWPKIRLRVATGSWPQMEGSSPSTPPSTGPWAEPPQQASGRDGINHRRQRIRSAGPRHRHIPRREENRSASARRSTSASIHGRPDDRPIDDNCAVSVTADLQVAPFRCKYGATGLVGSSGARLSQPYRPGLGIFGADDGTRTRDPHLGKKKMPDSPTCTFANSCSMIGKFE